MEKHPEIVRINAEITENEKLIRQEVANEVSRIRTKYLLAKAEEDSISRALETQKLEALRIEEVNQKLSDLQVVANTNQQIFETLQKKIKEADLSALIRSNNIRIVDKALKPGRPIRPTVASNILLAFIVGLLGGVALALLLEYLDDTLKTNEDIDRYLKIPVLGVIPHMTTDTGDPGERKPLEFIPIREPTSTVSEFYRTFRTNVLFLSRSKAENRLMIVSTGPGEGKTVTAINLAVTLSQIGQRTVLIDLDFRRPKLHTCFQTESRKGLTNVLVGELSLDEAITRSEIPNLDYLLAGSIPPNPAELMSSPELAAVLEELSKRYDRVVIDSSPIAPVTDAVIAAQIVHGVVLVVRAGKTHRKAVLFAHEQLKTVAAHVLGAVLNDVDISKATYGSYQYYKYGYSAYASGHKPDEERRRPDPEILPEAGAS
jgi:capsular exopolysaccharide synthesis family protein